MKNYEVIEITSPINERVLNISSEYDLTENDRNDSLLLNEVFVGRVDILITEDKKIHKKAEILNIQDKVFYINSFLEKIYVENPDLVNYKVLNVQKSSLEKYLCPTFFLILSRRIILTLKIDF